MEFAEPFIIGGDNGVPVCLNLSMANRHGLIAGATGTGKTVSLQVMAENFSRHGVPVFMADVKGDLSGLAAKGSPHRKIEERLEKIPLPGYQQRAYPTVFWDLYGEKGHPARSTISDFGPLLLANVLDLNQNQTGLLFAAFRIADDEGMLMLDLKDLKAVLSWMKDNRKSLEGEYGGIASTSIAAIQRGLMVLEEQGGDIFFGEPALELEDLLKSDLSGNGVINILNASRLIGNPRLYGLFLLSLISELFEELPEVGDADKPKLVFFFDEAHLLFDYAPPPLLDKINQVVRLIRSKGVGIYFVTQSPSDIPEDILGQLGNRIQHALRAFTPRDQKAVRVAAETFRPNTAFSTETAITQLGIGEALVSVLDDKGSPTCVQKTLVAPPQSRIGPLSTEERTVVMSRSPFANRYDQALDRESAWEILNERARQHQATVPAEKTSIAKGSRHGRQSVWEAMAKSAARSIGSALGRQIIRGILGSLSKGR